MASRRLPSMVLFATRFVVGGELQQDRVAQVLVVEGAADHDVVPGVVVRVRVALVGLTSRTGHSLQDRATTGLSGAREPPRAGEMLPGCGGAWAKIRRAQGAIGRMRS
jgi:hypothetical protein